jgi:decaprenyl-phosphate phosphoribosyltransferase
MTSRPTSPGVASVVVDPDSALLRLKEAARGGLLRGLVRTLRPHQWVKNLFVLAPMFFHKDVFLATTQGPALNLTVTARALAATAVFCFLAGAIYTLNDIADVAG